MWKKNANKKNGNDPYQCDFFCKDNKLHIINTQSSNIKSVNIHSNKLKSPEINSNVKTKSNKPLLQKQMEQHSPQKKSLKKMIPTISNSKIPESQKETLSQLTKSKRKNHNQQLVSPRIQQLNKQPITNVTDKLLFPCMQPQHIVIANTTIINNIIKNSEYYPGVKIHTKEIKPFIKPKTIDRQSSLKEINKNPVVIDPLKRSGSHKQLFQLKKQKSEQQVFNKMDNNDTNNNNQYKTDILSHYLHPPQRKTFQDLSFRSIVSSIENNPRLSLKQQSEQQSEVIQYLMDHKMDG